MQPKRKELQDLVVAFAIGDGHLHKTKRMRNASLDIVHCIDQRDFIQWKREVLLAAGFSVTEIRAKKARFPQCRISTRNDPFWTQLHAQIYAFRNTPERKRKRVTPKFLSKLTLRSLLVWFLDDGYNNPDRNYVHLGTYQHPYEEQVWIQRWVKTLTGAELVIGYRKDMCYLRTYRDASLFKGALRPVAADLGIHSLRLTQKKLALSSTETRTDTPTKVGEQV